MKKLLAHLYYFFICLCIAPVYIIRTIFCIPSVFYNELKVQFMRALCPLPQSIRKHLNMFCIHGLKQNAKFLQSLSIKEMLSWEIEEIAEYADRDTLKHIQTICYIGIRENQYEFMYSHGIQPTFIGNLAYVRHTQSKRRNARNSFQFFVLVETKNTIKF